MSVRPTQTKSGYPRRTRQPYPTGDQGPAGPEASDQRATGAPTDPDSAATAPPPEVASRPPDRKSQRAARRTRRNVAIVCGLVVALCLILTILIVDMARNRTSGPLFGVSPVALSSGLPQPIDVPSLTPYHPFLDAPASEGGNP
jgi:hypothetical protein